MKTVNEKRAELIDYTGSDFTGFYCTLKDTLEHVQRTESIENTLLVHAYNQRIARANKLPESRFI